MGSALHSRMKRLEESLGVDQKGSPVIVWRDLGVSAEETKRNYLAEYPEHAGKEIIVVGWME